MLLDEFFWPQNLEQESFESILGVAFQIDAVIKMTLHLLIVLLHLSLFLKFHRAEEGGLYDPYHDFMIVSDIQFVESFIDAVL